MLSNGSTTSAFWDCFDRVFPEAARCRFFATAMSIANGRLKEYDRESGPFLEAIKREHLPCAIRRLNTLKKAAEGLKSFEPDYDDFRLVDVRDPLKPVFAIVSKFEQEVVDPLDRVRQTNDEPSAEELVKSLKAVARRIVQTTNEQFTKLAAELERAVANCVVARTPQQPKFISCVSIDMAQYGRHAKILDDHIEAKGVIALTGRIQRAIRASLKSNHVPTDSFVVIDTGDGALVILLSSKAETEAVIVEQAVNFSRTFLTVFGDSYSSIDSDNQLHFRTGICSGFVEIEEVRVRGSDLVQCRVGGISIGTAVRLQSAARTGEIVICRNTWRRLSEPLKAMFNAEENVLGKVHEKTPIPAHRLTCVQARPEER